MKTENDKKGFFDRLFGRNKAKKCSCCANFELEEILDEKNNDVGTIAPDKEKNEPCCK